MSNVKLSYVEKISKAEGSIGEFYHKRVLKLSLGPYNPKSFIPLKVLCIALMESLSGQYFVYSLLP